MKRPLLSRAVSMLLLLFGGIVAASCTKVVETRPIVVSPGVEGGACLSAMGGYHLPKGLITLTASSDGARTTLDPDTIGVALVPDRRFNLCLDYLNSASSDDMLLVRRTSGDLLLQVSSDVTDRTPQIAQKLIVAASNFVIAAMREGTGKAGRAERLDLAFDPFDRKEMAAAKTALRHFGFCLYIEGHSFPRTTKSVEGWCDAKDLPPYDDPALDIAEQPLDPYAPSSNILYRANQSFRMVILRREEPGAGKWGLYVAKNLEMPNLSPIFGVGVERALFAQRKTTLTFDSGVLTGVSIDKKSELLGFVSIPLVLAQAIVDVPTRIVQLRISDANKRAELIDAQGQLINAISSYNRNIQQAQTAAAAASEARSGGGASPYRTRVGEFISGCLDGGMPDDECRRLQKEGNY
jgi:hypothetical protein